MSFGYINKDVIRLFYINKVVLVGIEEMVKKMFMLDMDMFNNIYILDNMDMVDNIIDHTNIQYQEGLDRG
jgi:hypothetical protein